MKQGLMQLLRAQDVDGELETLKGSLPAPSDQRLDGADLAGFRPVPSIRRLSRQNRVNFSFGKYQFIA